MVSATKHDSHTPANPAAVSLASAAAKRRQPPAETRKRKRGDDAPPALAQKSITIRPCPTSPYDRPITLTPVKLIERSQLPLSFLDVTGSSSSSIRPSSTRLFSAHVEALEHHHASGNNGGGEDDKEEDGDVPTTPKVLVTRYEADKCLYAVERVRAGVYALCKLGAWVREEHVGAVPAYAVGLSYAQPLKALKREGGAEPGGLWWQGAAVATPAVDTTALVEEQRRDGSAPRLSMRRPAPRIVQTAAVTTAPPPREADPFVDSAEPFAAGQLLPVGGMVEERPQTAEDVFQAVVQQYLEALYLTKTSLAFFVKGPMSRARAAFASKENTILKVGDLAAFLRSILLQPGPMDKKHREKLPEIIKSMPLPGLSDDEDAAAAAKMEKKKRSKSKKLKPNKEGLYPGEDEHVKKWWLQDRPGSSPHGLSESPADVLKRRLGDLRFRESMAQVILVLEIMAFEASPSFQATQQEETQQTETQTESQAPPVKKRKSKKPQDLNVLLDLLLDRLCIWQSVEQDETLIKVFKPGSGKNDALTPSSGKSGTSDKLKNFCVEVILPFYMSRLPEKAAAINKRLGGPSASPAKASSSGSNTHRSKPGEAAIRTDPRAAAVQKRRRPLSRVATENAAHHQPPQLQQPSLTRSSTDPLLLPPALKREGSETPSLSSIPLQQQKETSKTSASRNSLSQFERFSRRTIDLDAMSKSNEAKLRKKAHVERELEKAIGTLRKPNRGAALKDVADSADSRRNQQQQQQAAPRTTATISKAGGSAATTAAARKAGSSSSGSSNTVLVGATPKRGSKTKDVVLQATPNHSRFATSFTPAAAAQHLAGVDDDEDASLAPPMASEPVIPSSAVRPSTAAADDFSAIAIPGFVVPASVVKNASVSASRRDGGGGGGVEETPSRGPAGKTVHWFFPPAPNSGGSGGDSTDDREDGVAATPESAGVSNLGERLKASASASASASAISRRGSGSSSLKVPLPPVFKLPAEPLSSRMGGGGLTRVGEEESGESEDELGGVAALMRTPTKARRGEQVLLETPAKRAVKVDVQTPVRKFAVGETPVKQAPVGVKGESKGKEEKEVIGDGAEGMEEEGGPGDSIYNALGWDDIDGLA